MAHLHPFRALRPRPDVAPRIASVPYDVIDSDEARALADGNPHSFLHIIRPEIDLDEDVDLYSDAVYERGAANLRAYAASDHAVEEAEPSVYIYRQIMDGRAQTGVYACVAVADYDADVILKHEKTRPKKEDDRTRHILTQRAHAEPVMLTYRDDARIDTLVAAAMQQGALYDFTAPDGVQHTIWRAARGDAFVEAFKDVAHLYVADGHHRCKAASRAADERKAGPGDEAAYFPAVLFPMGQMEILAYNRIVYDLPDEPAAFRETLDARLELTPTDEPVPEAPGIICVYLGGTWYRAALPDAEGDRVADQLDVARLGEHLLEPVLDITDPRTDPNIDFVGGIRGTNELERRVDAGQAQLAISMYPTSIEELVAVSDAGQLMPPKSTWFEPKLRSGLLVHRFDTD